MKSEEVISCDELSESSGKIVDHYGVRDDIDMMRQLGLIPPEKPFDPSRLKLPEGSEQSPPAK